MTGRAERSRPGQDEHLGATVAMAIAFLALIVAAMVVSHAMTGGMDARPPLTGPVPRAAVEALPEPRLQTDPAVDLAEVGRAAAARLDGYAWVDRDRGTVRIPVERAAALLAAEGRHLDREGSDGEEDR